MDDIKILSATSESEKALMLEAAKFGSVMENVYEELAPHKICAYIYDLANALTVSTMRQRSWQKRMNRSRRATLPFLH